MSTEHLLGDMSAVLEALMGVNDGPRQEAEIHLRTLVVRQPGEILLVLAQIGALGVGGFQLDSRLLSLILLRRVAFQAQPGLFLNSNARVASAPFDVVKETVRNRIEEVICAGLKDEADVRLRKGLGSCAASWAQESAARQRPCLPLPPVLLGLTASPHPFHRYTPFQLLYETPTLLVDSVTETIPIEQLAQILLGGMNDPSVDVRVEAILATKSVLIDAVTGSERAQVGAPLVYEVFKKLPQLPLDTLHHAILPLVDLATLYPNLFLPDLSQILPYLLSLLSPPSSVLFPYTFSSYPPTGMGYEEWEDIANPATEIILSLADLRRPQIIEWEGGRVGKEMVGLLIARQVGALLGEGEECTQWIEETDLDDEDENYPSFSEEMLDALANALEGETILPSLSEHLQALLKQPDWRGRYCALVALGSVAEGCIQELTPMIRDVLNLISASAKDPHPRVRYAFIHCLGQLLNDCEGILQDEYSSDVLQILLAFLSDPIARVRTHTIACLANFYGYEQLKPPTSTDLEPVINALIQVFPTGPIYLQERVITTLSSIAIQAELAFLPFFGKVMALLLLVLTAESDPKYHKLVGKSMECASLIGRAVGKANFVSQAVNLATIMINIQNQVDSSSDVRSGYLMEAWANICRVIGKDFAPFLSYVVPPLLQAAAYIPPKDDPGLLAGSDEKEEADAHTDEIEDKHLAFSQLMVYAIKMGAWFAPYLERSMSLTLEALTFQYSDDVRRAAAFLIPCLLDAAKEASLLGDERYTTPVYKVIVKAITKELDYAFLAVLYKKFKDSMIVVDNPPANEVLITLLNTTQAHLIDLRASRTERASQEWDDSDYDMLLDQQADENTCLEAMDEALASLKKGLGAGTSHDGVRNSIDQFRIEITSVRETGLAEDDGLQE